MHLKHLSALLSTALAADDGGALTPPRGWRSWNQFNGAVTHDDEGAEAKASAALDDFRHPIDVNHSVIQLKVIRIQLRNSRLYSHLRNEAPLPGRPLPGHAHARGRGIHSG